MTATSSWSSSCSMTSGSATWLRGGSIDTCGGGGGGDGGGGGGLHWYRKESKFLLLHWLTAWIGIFLLATLKMPLLVLFIPTRQIADLPVRA